VAPAGLCLESTPYTSAAEAASIMRRRHHWTERKRTLPSFKPFMRLKYTHNFGCCFDWMEILVFQIKGTAQNVFQKMALGLGMGVYFYLRGKTSSKAAEHNILVNTVSLIPGNEIVKSWKVRCFEHVESMGVKRSSCVILAVQIEYNVSR
jgi:hypothetical protein